MSNVSFGTRISAGLSPYLSDVINKIIGRFRLLPCHDVQKEWYRPLQVTNTRPNTQERDSIQAWTVDQEIRVQCGGNGPG